MSFLHFVFSELLYPNNRKEILQSSLHGGLGTEQIEVAPKFQRQLEKEFIVILSALN